MKVNMWLILGGACLVVTTGGPFAVALAVGECADGIDNDGDGDTDWLGTAFPNWDNGCTWAGDPSEEEFSVSLYCPHSGLHSHTYFAGGSVTASSDTLTSGDEIGAGFAAVFDTNLADCDGDGLPGDSDGDYDLGIGGAFFGHGPWADEPTCYYGLAQHGSTVSVNDVAFAGDVWFVIGADDTSGPVITVDPVTGGTTCSTDGSITPGDPALDPTADADDCLTDPQYGTGTTCGAGGDGGYWVFLSGLHVYESGGGSGFGNAPTAGTVTA